MILGTQNEVQQHPPVSPSIPSTPSPLGVKIVKIQGNY